MKVSGNFVSLFFFRMPVLYEELGVPGRVLSCLFFLCLSLAGISSLVAMFELPVHTLEEMRSRFTLTLSVLQWYLYDFYSGTSIILLVRK